MSFIAGTYSATYNSLDLGIIEDGFTIEWTSRAEDIVSDVNGDAKVDGVYRGLEMNVSFILSEWDAAGAQGAFWPFAATLGEIGQIGRLLTSMSKTLILTKCGSTANQVPATITLRKQSLVQDSTYQPCLLTSIAKYLCRCRFFQLVQIALTTYSSVNCFASSPLHNLFPGN